jgi:Zn ribbon nucleic-acid-binding protein
MTSSLSPLWRNYRTRRRLFAVATLGLVPALAGSTKALPELAGSGATGHVLLALCITAFVGTAGWFASFRCPFCGDHFHWTLWVADPFSDECLHCGFRKWRDPHAARAFARR